MKSMYIMLYFFPYFCYTLKADIKLKAL